MVLCPAVTNLAARALAKNLIPNQANRNLLPLLVPAYFTVRGVSSRNVPIVAHATAAGKDEARQFMALFPDLVRDLTDAGRHLDIPEATKWFSKVLQYNVPGGKKNRGLAVVLSYKTLMGNDLTPDGLFLAQLAGWCVEMLQARFLIDDDIMDGALTRRNRPCWYRTNNLGVKAINDGIYLDAAIYQLLRKYMRDKPYYTDITELFNDVTFKTVMGQCLDVHCLTEDNRPNLDVFTMDRYTAIVKYKTAYYSFQLPVALALYMAGITDPELHRQAKIVLLEMGHFYQVQDDFLDCFGDPDVIGKVGTDIEDGKCSWLVVLALQRANQQQRKTIQDFYGYNDPEKVSEIKRLYEELGIPSTYSTYEEESYNIISTHIQQMSAGLPHDLFFTILKKIYRRDN